MYTIIMVACSFINLECSINVGREVRSYKECVQIGKLFNQTYAVSDLYASSFRCDLNV